MSRSYTEGKHGASEHRGESLRETLLNKELFRQIKYARYALALTISFGVLGAVVMIAQMALLSRVVNQVFLAHESLSRVELLLLFLLGTIIVRAGLVWTREVTAQHGAMRIKAELR